MRADGSERLEYNLLGRSGSGFITIIDLPAIMSASNAAQANYRFKGLLTIMVVFESLECVIS